MKLERHTFPTYTSNYKADVWDGDVPDEFKAVYLFRNVEGSEPDKFIIRFDYPESIQIINDLKKCIGFVNQVEYLDRLGNCHDRRIITYEADGAPFITLPPQKW